MQYINLQNNFLIGNDVIKYKWIKIQMSLLTHKPEML